jgi:hypothetical protein
LGRPSHFLLSWSLEAYPTVPVVVVAVGCTTVFVVVEGIRKRFETKSLNFPASDTVTRFLLSQGIPKGQDLLVLHDVKTKETLTFKTAVVETLAKTFSVTCVLAASPKESNFQDFVKTTRCGDSVASIFGSRAGTITLWK